MSAGIRIAFLLTAVLLSAAAAVRIWAVPRFTIIPGYFQILLEQFVSFLDILGCIPRAFVRLCRGIPRAAAHIADIMVKVAVQSRKGITIWLALSAVLLFAALTVPPLPGNADTSALPQPPVDLSGVNTGALPFFATAVILLLSAAARLWIIPRFTVVPGHVQLVLEQFVRIMDRVGQILHAIGVFFRGIALALSHAVNAVCGFVSRNRKAVAIWLGTAGVFLVAGLMTPAPPEHGDVTSAMRDAVLHDVNRISLFGLKDVNPGLIAAMTVTGFLLFTALLLRIFLIPRMRLVPGRVQLVLEEIINLLDGQAHSRGRISFIGAYVFAAGTYIFTGTLFELLGLQAVATNGASVTLPAPLSDVNAAICMGCASYLVIFGGGVIHAGAHGAKAALKEFSLPISMSFRLFGALLSGLLVTDLIYHYAALRIVLPVVAGVIFTLLHALIQSYVLTMLVGIYYEEVSEKPVGTLPEQR